MEGACGRGLQSGPAEPPPKCLHSFFFQSLRGREWPREDPEGQPRPLPGRPMGPPEVRRYPSLSGPSQTYSQWNLTNTVAHYLLSRTFHSSPSPTEYRLNLVWYAKPFKIPSQLASDLFAHPMPLPCKIHLIMQTTFYFANSPNLFLLPGLHLGYLLCLVSQIPTLDELLFIFQDPPTKALLWGSDVPLHVSRVPSILG